MISAIRMARMPEANKLDLKAMLIDELGSILAARPDLPVVKLADEAHDNWTFFDHAIPFGAEAIDFFHAAEHLGAALAAAYGDGTRQTRRRFEDLRDALLGKCASLAVSNSTGRSGADTVGPSAAATMTPSGTPSPPR